MVIWEYSLMKTTLDLPDELFREVKLRAVVQGRTVKDLVTELLQQGLGIAPAGPGKQRPTSERVKIGKRGLPVIHCRPQAPAAQMSAEALLKLEQETQTEEDLKRAGITH